jgi:hypothetical protein
MRIIISVIVIIILILFLLLLIKSNYTTETFITQKDLDDIKNYNRKVTDTYDTIDNPIEDSLIPYNPNDSIKITDYDVIEIYKYIYDRPPTIQELHKYTYYTKDELKELLYNSPEYDKLIKTQNNDVNNGIEGAIAKRNLINRIIKIYSTIYKDDLSVKMMVPLRDCFIHLQLNEYLFTAMLEAYNYKKFEVDVLATYVLTKKVLYKLFYKHFNVLELKLIAQEKINSLLNTAFKIKKQIDAVKKDILTVSATGSTEAASTIIDTLKINFPNVYSELVKTTIAEGTDENFINMNTLNNYLTKIEQYQNINNTTTPITPTPITPTPTTPITPTPITPTPITPTPTTPPTTQEIETNNNSNVIEKLELSRKTKKSIDNMPDDAELYIRIYEPIVHNNSYVLPQGYKPPICTSIGQSNLTQPVFTQSKLLFQGTDLKSAFRDTQVGSIMPKFIYKEYTDVKVN